MTDLACVLTLHDENFNAPVSLVAEILRDNGVTVEEDLPRWFTETLSAALSRSNFSKVYRTSNLDFENALLELAQRAGWHVDDQGESLTVSFPRSGLSVSLNREFVDDAGDGIVATWRVA